MLHAEILHDERKDVETLKEKVALSATPIPRTLYLSLMNAKDMSLLETPPQSRLPIRTVVTEYREALVKEALDLDQLRAKNIPSADIARHITAKP